MTELPDTMLYQRETRELLWSYNEDNEAWSTVIQLDENSCIKSVAPLKGERISEESYERLASDVEYCSDAGLKHMLREGRLIVWYSLDENLTSMPDSGGWLVDVTAKEIALMYDALNRGESLNDVQELNEVLDRAFFSFLSAGLPDFNPKEEYSRCLKQGRSLPPLEEYAEDKWKLGFWFGDSYDEFDFIGNE
ncbi:MAG: hypothetical protein MJ075_07290 [Oscillospiraceae bacterium]|nr:hypothetical protein [Oscillospiraceae bacterium]